MRGDSCENCEFMVSIDGNYYCGKDMIKHNTEYYNEQIYDLENTKCSDHERK